MLLCATVFKLSVILLLSGVRKSQKVSISPLTIGIDSQVTNHAVAMEKVTEQYILTKSYKCYTFPFISDLLHDFMTCNALKYFKN